MARTPGDFSTLRIAVIGTGLIGTSVALALARRGARVLLSDRDPGALRAAVARGAGEPLGEAAPADVAVLAVPPAALASALLDAQKRRLAAFYTDVVSVKTRPLDEAAALGCDLGTFVAGHPMAGGERSGPAAARADLFTGRPWILCPQPRTRAAAVAAATELILACGAVPTLVGARAHDRAVALVSHAPHVVSVALAARLEGAPDRVLALSGQGLSDLTRKAAGDPRLWLEILMANPGPVAEVLDEVALDLAGTAAALRAAARRPAGAERDVQDLLHRGRDGRARIPQRPRSG